MKTFYKIPSGALQLKTMFTNFNGKVLNGPKMLFQLATTNDPKANIKNTSKGQFDWTSSIKVMIDYEEILEILKAFKKATKNFKLPFKASKDVWDHIPEKGIKISFYHGRNNNTGSIIMITINKKEAKKKLRDGSYQTYYHLEMWLNLMVKENGATKKVEGTDKNNKKIQREQNFSINLNSSGNDLESFVYYLRNFINSGYLMQDALMYIKYQLGNKETNEDSNTSNKSNITKLNKSNTNKNIDTVDEDIDELDFDDEDELEY